MPINFDTTASQTQRRAYRSNTPPPVVEVSIVVDTGTNMASMQVRVSGAAGAAQIVQVLRALANKIETDFGVV